jgi:DNA-binding MarR family transcriptional regulator
MGRIEDDIKQKEFKNEYGKAYINLAYTYHHFHSLTAKVIKSKKITHQQYNVLRILRGSYPDSKRIGDVKAVMIDKNPDLTRLIDRLLTKGYVSRTNCDEDRRQVNVIITKEGLKLLKELDKEMENWDDMLKAISVEEAKQLNTILDKWRG